MTESNKLRLMSETIRTNNGSKIVINKKRPMSYVYVHLLEALSVLGIILCLGVIG